MAPETRVEVLSAGCSCCEDAVRLARSIAGPADEVTVRDMHSPEIAARAKDLGVQRVPAVVVNGELAECCSVPGVSEAGLRAAGIGRRE